MFHSRFKVVKRDEQAIELRSSVDVNQRVVVHTAPLKLEFLVGDELVSVFNARGLLKFEHYRNKPTPPPPAPVDDASANATSTPPPPPPASDDENEASMWEETFKSHTDSKPYGPESVGMDVSFVGYEHVYGIPQHADQFSLRSTT